MFFCIVTQVILAFWLVLTYDRLEDRRRESMRSAQEDTSCLWRWLPHRLWKRQSLTTVLLRTPVTQMIFFNPCSCVDDVSIWWKMFNFVFSPRKHWSPSLHTVCKCNDFEFSSNDGRNAKLHFQITFLLRSTSCLLKLAIVSHSERISVQILPVIRHMPYHFVTK